VKNEATQANNGIYTWATGGTVLTRATDFDTAAEMASGDFTFITNGTLYSNTGWVQTFEVVTVGSDTVIWQQFSGTGTFTAGNGLTIAGTEFNVVGTSDRITVNPDSIDIASTYVGQSSITTLGTISTGVWNGSVIGDSYINDALTISGGTINNTPIGGSTASSAAFTTLTANGAVTFTSATDASNLTTAAVILSGGLSVTKKIYVGTDIIGAGAATSDIDGFNIDGGTY
jgi:hypothetical protein